MRILGDCNSIGLNCLFGGEKASEQFIT